MAAVEESSVVFSFQAVFNKKGTKNANFKMKTLRFVRGEKNTCVSCLGKGVTSSPVGLDDDGRGVVTFVYHFFYFKYYNAIGNPCLGNFPQSTMFQLDELRGRDSNEGPCQSTFNELCRQFDSHDREGKNCTSF